MKQATHRNMGAAILAMIAGNSNSVAEASQVGTTRIAGYQTKSTVTGVSSFILLRGLARFFFLVRGALSAIKRIPLTFLFCTIHIIL
jgi:hypothetical protein